MTTASGSLRAVRPVGARRRSRSIGGRGAGASSASRSSLVALLLIWEGAKWLGGDPWRLHGTIAGIQIDYEHVPPLKWRIADDLSLPHVWDIGRAFVDPAQRGGPPLGVGPRRPGRCSRSVRRWPASPSAARSASASAILFVHSRLAERALRPVRRRLADRADPGHRAARRRRDQGGLAVGHGGRAPT